MADAELAPKRVRKALVQFIFPFSIVPGTEDDLIERLSQDGYVPFFLDRMEQEDAYYGEGYRVSHKRLERYFLPFTGQILFPHRQRSDAFRRYSRPLSWACVMECRHQRTPFRVHSVDVIVCPFAMGFLTVRVEADGGLEFSEALEFTARLRSLEDVSDKDDNARVHCDGQVYEQVEDFLFHKLALGVLPFLDRTSREESYFETLPFFVDERMFIQAFYQFEPTETITRIDEYRAAQLDGFDDDGKPYVSANNIRFIRDYIERHGYHRWRPSTVYLANEHTFTCLTSRDGKDARDSANQMYGEYYYGLLLNLFHKLVLLKLSSRYSHVRMGKDSREVEELIRSITAFSAKYYFLELVSQAQGRDIFMLIRRVFGNDELLGEVKMTLTDLYKYQDREEAKSTNYLLMILTVYTVIGGIYGMNQVIEDLKHPIDWSKMLAYSPFEYLALFLTMTGIVVGIVLGIVMLYKWVKDIAQRRRDQKRL